MRRFSRLCRRRHAERVAICGLRLALLSGLGSMTRLAAGARCSRTSSFLPSRRRRSRTDPWITSSRPLFGMLLHVAKLRWRCGVGFHLSAVLQRCSSAGTSRPALRFDWASARRAVEYLCGRGARCVMVPAPPLLVGPTSPSPRLGFLASCGQVFVWARRPLRDGAPPPSLWVGSVASYAEPSRMGRWATRPCADTHTQSSCACPA